MPIKSEAKFFWRLLLSILKIPFTLLMILFGKKSSKDLNEPLNEITTFIFETKFTTNIIIINILLYITVSILLFLGIIDANFIERIFISYPSDLFNFNIFRIITSWFMHGSVVHLMGNMLFLFILGRVVEKEFGFRKTMFIYFGSALISSIFNALIYIYYLGEEIGGIGASGAIAGLASVAMLVSPMYLTFLIVGIPVPIFVVSWSFLISEVSGVLNPIAGDNIGHYAHLGGFFAIAILVFLFDKKDRKRFVKGLIFNVITLLFWAFIKFYEII